MIPPALWVDLGTDVPDPEPPPMHSTLEDKELEAALAAEARPGPDGDDSATLDLIERHARDRLRAWVVGGEASPPRVGRFTLLRRLGSGGMGTVYSAYDDELDRRVALKFLHPGRADDPTAQHRLLREAQALARLSHPHLVPVFEVGRFDDQVYLAMELVEGLTARQWVERERPGWREVLGSWLDIGRALQVVHGQGLVHRDVKPDNVIIGDDGRARLLDFGLAREVGTPVSARELESGGTDRPSASSSWGSGSRLRESVTHSRAIIGTPAYLAPEQRMGEPCGPAADQYSFCVSLYEGLFGCRPPGPNMDGELVRIPEGRKVPTTLRRTLSRGLKVEPGDRFRSMDELLRELERPLRRARWGWLGAGAGILAVGVLAGALVSDRGDAVAAAPKPCEGVEEGIAEVWNDGAREQLAGTEHAGLIPALDDFAEQWGQARVQTCEATHVEGLQSVQVLDRRVLCLDRQRDRLGGLIAAAPEGRRLGAGLSELGAPSDCLLPGVAEGAGPPPPEWMRPEIASIEAQLARVAPLAMGGKIDEARTEARVALERAEAIGHEPTIAAALLELGTVEMKDFHGDAARLALDRAANLAEAHGDLLLKADALARLVRLATDVDADRQEALRNWHRNLATVRRLGSSPEWMARLMASFGLVRHLHGDRLGAEVSLRAADSLYSELGPRANPARASVQRNLGNLLSVQLRPREASEWFAAARGLDFTGADPSSAWSTTGEIDTARNEGNALLMEGRLAEARGRLELALAQSERAFGEKSAAAGYLHVSLAQLAINEGQLQAARRHAEAADLAIRNALGSDHPDRRGSLSALGTVAFEEGRWDAAVRAFDETLRLAVNTEPEDGLLVAQHRSNLAEALLAAGDHDMARVLAEQALRTSEARLPDSHVDLAFPLRVLGEVELRQGRPAEAVELLERASALHQSHGGYPVELARTRAGLARALHARGDLDQAREVGRDALAKFAALGPDYQADSTALQRSLDLPLETR